MSGALPQVGIVLLNYNGAEDTISCLKSLSKITYPNHEIVIVDNASTDFSIKIIEEYLSLEKINSTKCCHKECSTKRIPQITIIKSSTNRGYGAGNNIGIEHILGNNAEYILVLNNDTVVDKGFLEPLVETCVLDNKVGIASGKIYLYDKPNIFWFNGGKFHSFTSKVEHVNFNEKDIGQKTFADSTFISGCMWLIPRKIFDVVGFINEDYFMYIEDLEYCQRVLNHGYKLKVCERSHIFHKVGASTGGKYSEMSVYWRTRNIHLFIFTFSKTAIVKLVSITIYNLKLLINLVKAKKFYLIKFQIKGILNSIKER